MPRPALMSVALLAAFAGSASAQSLTTASMPVYVQLQAQALRLEVWGSIDWGYHNTEPKTLNQDATKHGWQFKMRGEAGRQVALTYPSAVALTGSKSAATLQYVPAAAGGQSCDWQSPRAAFASGAALTLSAAGEYCAWMGGTLTIGENIPADVYSGQISMSVAYLQ